MKAVICTKYGNPDVLELREVEKPVPKTDEVLIKIVATAVTASDCIMRRFEMPGNPQFPQKQLMELAMKLAIGVKGPRNPILGMVLSGEIQGVGSEVTGLKKGDQVYGFAGNSRGGYAEYKCMNIKEIAKGGLALKPSNISHEEAAAITYGGILASHFMKDAHIKNGQKVLIYGASGAIGTIAVQLAKSYGATVTGVCSSTNMELVKSLGAIEVIDYTDNEATKLLGTYDFILDAVGKNKESALKMLCQNALNPDGKYISVDDSLLKQNASYFIELNKFIESGELKAVIDRRFSLENIREAHHYVDQGHKKGNVVINVV